MIAYGIHTYYTPILMIIILTVLTLYSVFFATLIWNDITDETIDRIQREINDRWDGYLRRSMGSDNHMSFRIA